MEIVYDDARPRRATWREAVEAARAPSSTPVLIDQFLEDAIEVDVDVVADGTRRGRRRRDGAHRGGRHPLRRLGLRAAAATRCRPTIVERDQARRRARSRASSGVRRPDERPVRRPATSDGLRPRGQPARVAHGAVRLQGDRRAAGQDRGARDGRQDARASWASREVDARRTSSVKEAVFPFAKFPGVDTILGPEMRSTGEVMGIDDRLRDRVRQEPDRRRHASCRRRARRSSRCRTATRPGAVAVAKGLIDLGLRGRRHRGTHDVPDRQGARRQAGQQGARGPAAHASTGSSTATSTWSSTPPRAPQAIKDSFPIRRNALLQGDPLLHDAVGGARRRRRHRRSARRQDDGPLAAGVPEWLSSR